MRPLANVIRRPSKSGFSTLLLAVTFTLGTILGFSSLGFSSDPSSEETQANYSQAGNRTSSTPIIYDYSTASDLRIHSQAFPGGWDQGLATALSRCRAVEHCLIAEDPSFDIAFFQMVPKPTGRKITFITNRPPQRDEIDPAPLLIPLTRPLVNSA
jgi:hypothetical protein